MKIIVKTQLLPAVASTRLTVRVAAGDTVTLASLAQATGHSAVTVEWGDGEATEAPGGKFTHAYAAAGEYVIRISDNIQSLIVTGTDADALLSAPLVTGFWSDAQELTAIANYGLSGCVNLTALSFDNSAIASLLPGVFKGCAALSGTIRLPTVNNLAGIGNVQPFGNCTGGITEIRFAAAHEAAITSSASYKKDNTLGTGTAVVKFNL